MNMFDFYYITLVFSSANRNGGRDQSDHTSEFLEVANEVFRLQSEFANKTGKSSDVSTTLDLTHHLLWDGEWGVKALLGDFRKLNQSFHQGRNSLCGLVHACGFGELNELRGDILESLSARNEASGQTSEVDSRGNKSSDIDVWDTDVSESAFSSGKV